MKVNYLPDDIESGYYLGVGDEILKPLTPFQDEKKRVVEDIKKNFVGTFAQIEAEIDKSVAQLEKKRRDLDKKKNKRRAELALEFENDLFEFCGVAGNPKAKELLTLINRRFDSYNDIYIEFDEFCLLIKD
jgi:Skp family chaperone for outer membrane proteins